MIQEKGLAHRLNTKSCRSGWKVKVAQRDEPRCGRDMRHVSPIRSIPRKDCEVVERVLPSREYPLCIRLLSRAAIRLPSPTLPFER